MSGSSETGAIPEFLDPLVASRIITDKFTPRTVDRKSSYRRLEKQIEYKDLEPSVFIGTAGSSPTGIPNGIEMHSDGKRYLFIREEFNLYTPEYDDITDSCDVPQTKMSLAEIEFFIQRTKEVLERNPELDELRNYLSLAWIKYKEIKQSNETPPQIG